MGRAGDGPPPPSAVRLLVELAAGLQARFTVTTYDQCALQLQPIGAGLVTLVQN